MWLIGVILTIAAWIAIWGGALQWAMDPENVFGGSGFGESIIAWLALGGSIGVTALIWAVISRVVKDHDKWRFQADQEDTGSQSHSQHQRTSSSSHQKQQAPPPRPPKPEPVPDCYTILDLSLSCTQEEASAAYRKLAKQYHPDMVSHLAPEFQKMAEEKMKDFNKAYTELKRLRGW